MSLAKDLSIPDKKKSSLSIDSNSVFSKHEMVAPRLKFFKKANSCDRKYPKFTYQDMTS
jgi:hypothetical protein